MEVKKIYFDMDGVLADFDRGVVELCHLPVLDQKVRDDAKDDELYAAMRKIDHYYDKLKLMPGAKEMFLTIYEKYGDKCEILSGVPKPKRGITTFREDKVTWMRRLLSDKIKMNLVYWEEKKDYCFGPEYILIDDLEVNVRMWEACGGTGIIHENPQKTMDELRKLGVLE